MRPLIVLFLENARYADVIQDPSHRRILDLSTVHYTKYHATNHPSQPNYIHLFAGSDLGVDNNNFCNIPPGTPTLIHLLEEKGISWAGYIEDYPGSSFKGNTKGLYVRKHDPFSIFEEIRVNCPERIINANKKVRGKTRFEDDAEKGLLPEFIFYSPNMDNNGHDTDIETGGKHALNLVNTVLNAPQHPIIIVTYDEDMPYTEENHIFCALVDPLAKEKFVDDNYYNHCSLLRTIEDYFGLGRLGTGDVTAQSMF